MVGDAAKWLQDDKGATAFAGTLNDLGGNQDSLTGVIGTGNDRVACPGDICQLCGRLKQRMLSGDRGDKVVGSIEDLLDQIQISSLNNGFFDPVIFRLFTADKIGLLDDIRHLGLDDLKTVFLQIILNIVVGARMEIEQILTDDQDSWPGIGTIIGHFLHEADGLFKPLLHLADAAMFNGIHEDVQSFFEGFIGNSLHRLIGPHLAQEVFQRIDHGQCKGNLDRCLQIEFEAGVQVVIIHVIIRDDRHIRVACVVKSLAEQGSVVGQAAAADIFSHHDSLLFSLIFGVFNGLERLSDNHLGRETDIIMDIALSEFDRTLAADGKRNRMDLLGGKDSCHQPAEGVGSVGNEDNRILDILLLEFLRIGIRKFPDLSGTEGPGDRSTFFQFGDILFLGREDRNSVRILPPLCGRGHLQLQGLSAFHLHRGDEGTNADGKRSAYITFVHLEDQGGLAGNLLHHTDDLIRQIGVMTAAETHDLDIFQVGVLRGIDRRSKHPGMVIVDHIQTAL